MLYPLYQVLQTKRPKILVKLSVIKVILLTKKCVNIWARLSKTWSTKKPFSGVKIVGKILIQLQELVIHFTFNILNA